MAFSSAQREGAGERGLGAEIAAIHRAHRGAYDRPRIVRQLRAQGRPASEERVRRSLQRQGLLVVYRRACRVTTDTTHNLPVTPNLLDRRFDGWQPDRAWVSDITFLSTDEGWLYLAAILDLVSRRIVGWSMSECIDAELVYQVHSETRAQARLDIVDWIEGYYHRERLHTSIGFLTPVDFEAALIGA